MSTWSHDRVGRRIYLTSMFMVILCAGCAGPRVLMPTPALYADTGEDLFAELEQPLKRSEVRLLYVTDREPERDESGKLSYGSGRSASLAFGTTVVDLGTDTTWEELAQASNTSERLKPVKLALREIDELARTPDLPIPYSRRGDTIVEEQASLERLESATNRFRQAMVRSLDLTARKDVFIYVHGYHDTFQRAAFAMAELWHFLGRIGVPIVYTWPAGYPGLFGYTYDRESSEFTIYHLRETLKFIAAFPEVDRIHLIAHSRGTDVAVAAVRELTIAARAAGMDPRTAYKIHNIVLAAPDLDVQVATQRFAGDRIDLSANRWTIYTSPADRAIGVAEILFASPRGRIGTFGIEDLDDTVRKGMAFSDSTLAFVNYPETPAASLDRYAHSYFRSSPEVSSDLVLLLRDDLDPGSPGRPLQHIGLEFWEIPPGYPRRAHPREVVNPVSTNQATSSSAASM
jgi:esterase/lipase superfamily enzyme